MKALILAGGKGSRLRDHGAPPKPLLQVDGKRLMDFSLQNAVDAGATDIVVVVSASINWIDSSSDTAFAGPPPML